MIVWLSEYIIYYGCTNLHRSHLSPSDTPILFILTSGVFPMHSRTLEQMPKLLGGLFEF